MEDMELKEKLARAFSGKKVFITGHTGFKGSWLVRVLQLLGAEIKGYALAPTYHNTLFDLFDFQHSIDSVFGDILDAAKLNHEIQTFQPDFVFHLAAQPLVIASYQDPAYTFHVNATGTAYVLDAIRALEKKCVVVCITTDKVYENKEWEHPYKETDELGGYDPYSASKAAAEIVIQSYRRSFFNPASYAAHQKSIAVARAGNVIGGGDWSDNRLMPDIVKALFEQRNILIRKPYAIRPWQHVLEPIMGYLYLAQKQTEDPVHYASAFNFGPLLTDTVSVETIVQQAIHIWGSGHYEIQSNETDVHEAGILRLDISKAQHELQWQPKWDSRTAVEKTLDWYKQHAYDIRSLTDEQITTYLQ